MATQPENNDKAEEKISKDGLSEKQLAPGARRRTTTLKSGQSVTRALAEAEFVQRR